MLLRLCNRNLNFSTSLVIALLFWPRSGQASETIVKSPELETLFTDVSLYGVGDKAQVEQIFQKSGGTFYLENGGSSQGNWKIENDKYCSQWPPNPSWACYDVLRDGDVVTFVSSTGKRTPMSLKK